MCETIGISRDAYYKRSRRVKSVSSSRSAALRLVKDIRRDEPRTGTRKLHHRILPRLEREGLRVGRDALFDALRDEGMLVRPKKRFQRTTYSRHDYAVAPNRVKGTSVTKPNQVVVSDITYIALSKCFAYLFLVTDAYSRKIVGYHLSRDLTHYSALLALDRARQGMRDPAGLVHHSDRGCQYCCHEFLGYLEEHGMLSSMTDESHCYQNAIAERVNGILKDEFSLDAVFRSFHDALYAVKQAVTVYNSKRTHWSLGLRTPEETYRLAA